MSTLMVFVAGAATIPAGAIGWALFLRLLDKLNQGVRVIRLKVMREPSPTKRYATAALVGAAGRISVFAFGDSALVWITDVDQEERRRLRDAMARSVPREPITPAAKPGRRVES